MDSIAIHIMQILMHIVCLAVNGTSSSNYVVKICFLGFWHNTATWLSLLSHCTGHRAMQ